MNPTRQHFLQAAALSAFAANFPLTVFAQKPLDGPDNSFDPETLAIFSGVSPQTFEPWIGSRFRVSLNNKPRGSLVLLSVDEIGAETKEEHYSANATGRVGPLLKIPHKSATTSFSLRFQRVGDSLRQDSYMLSHDWLGDFPLFIVPSGLLGAPSTCSAIFTLLAPTGSNPSN